MYSIEFHTIKHYWSRSQWLHCYVCSLPSLGSNVQLLMCHFKNSLEKSLSFATVGYSVRNLGSNVQLLMCHFKNSLEKSLSLATAGYSVRSLGSNVQLLMCHFKNSLVKSLSHATAGYSVRISGDEQSPVIVRRFIACVSHIILSLVNVNGMQRKSELRRSQRGVCCLSHTSTVWKMGVRTSTKL
jgi:hypothetical protein